MSIQTRAALQTLGIITGIISISVLVSFLMTFITFEIGMYLLSFGIFAIFFKLIYDVVLGRLQYEEIVNKKVL